MLRVQEYCDFVGDISAFLQISNIFTLDPKNFERGQGMRYDVPAKGSMILKCIGSP